MLQPVGAGSHRLAESVKESAPRIDETEAFDHLFHDVCGVKPPEKGAASEPHPAQACLQDAGTSAGRRVIVYDIAPAGSLSSCFPMATDQSFLFSQPVWLNHCLLPKTLRRRRAAAG